jgi:hypothetical protein
MSGSCANAFGIKNIFITFTVCRGSRAGYVSPPISHSQFGDAMPMIRNVAHKNQQLPGKRGRVKQTPTPKSFEIEVEVEDNIPLAWYQGDATMDVDVEYLSGKIYNVLNAIPMGEEKSDTNSIKLNLDADEIGEFLAASPL